MKKQIRLKISTKELRETTIVDTTLLFMSVDMRAWLMLNKIISIQVTD